MAQQAAVETIGSWTEEQLKQAISEVVKEEISVLGPMGSLRSEMDRPRTEMREEMAILQARIVRLKKWVKTFFAILFPILLATLGLSIKLAIKG